ncbi:MAG: 3-oxoacyl-ACP synthase, partial [Phycisphaeraceae bacterium]|nr:3-oxoacyl-ACP synthase [Phycisphaeraceae bacterium]
KLYINIDRFANTSAASVPICLNELTEAGRVRPGDLVLMIALGGGLTWAASLWRL